MSTRLLTARPGSRHMITDDLESHYFVLVWTALHWVKHDQAGSPWINMERIFDQQQPLPDGTVQGGMGKERKYRTRDTELREVKFACEPFNELFWDLWMIFAEYLAQRLEHLRWGKPGSGEHSTGLELRGSLEF